jgi:hypothetical protein
MRAAFFQQLLIQFSMKAILRRVVDQTGANQFFQMLKVALALSFTKKGCCSATVSKRKPMQVQGSPVDE